MNWRVPGIVVCAMAWMTCASLAEAQTKPRAASKSGLDSELLKGLDGKSEPRAHPLENAAPESLNPLARIAERMRSVEGRMGRHDTSTATQQEQRQIVNDLAALLEQANQGEDQKPHGRKGSGSEQAGTGNATAGPPRDSTNRIEPGTKQQAETADVKEVLRRIWGHLPDKLREEMQAALSEQFLPKYEKVIEVYYKRLSEQRPER